MIIDYDHNPALTVDQKMQSLVENLMLAFAETADLLNKQQKQMEKSDQKIDKLLEALGVVAEDISTINENITTMQDDITALEAVAADAILQSTES